MHPILLQLDHPHVVVWSNQITLLAAIAVPLVLGPGMIARLEGLDARRVLHAQLWIGLAGLAGARAHFVLNQWPEFAGRPLAAFEIWRGGLHAGGGIIAVVLATPIVLHRLRLPIGRFADGLVPVVALSLVFMRLGCFLHGCCFGTVCSFPWCITFPQQSYVYQLHASTMVVPFEATRSAPVHPLQLYFGGVAILLGIGAWWLHPHRRYDGQIALLGLLFFSASSAALEFLRGGFPGRVYWGQLPQLEWTALGMTAMAAVALVVAEARERRRASVIAASV